MFSLILVVLFAVVHSQEVHTPDFNDAYQKYINDLLVQPKFNGNVQSNLVVMNAGHGGNNYGDVKPVQEPNTEAPPPTNMFGNPMMQLIPQTPQKPVEDMPQFAMLVGQPHKIPSATYGIPIPGSHHQIPQNGNPMNNLFTPNGQNFIPPNHNEDQHLHFDSKKVSQIQSLATEEQIRVAQLNNLNAQVLEAIKKFSATPMKTQGSNDFYMVADPKLPTQPKQFDFTLPTTPHKIETDTSKVQPAGLGDYKTELFETSEGLKGFNNLPVISLYDSKTPPFTDLESKFNIYHKFYNDKPLSGAINAPPKGSYNFGKPSNGGFEIPTSFEGFGKNKLAGTSFDSSGKYKISSFDGFGKNKFPVTSFDSHGFNGNKVLPSKFNTIHNFAGGKGLPKVKKSLPPHKPAAKRRLKGQRYVIKITKN